MAALVVADMISEWRSLKALSARQSEGKGGYVGSGNLDVHADRSFRSGNRSERPAGADTKFDCSFTRIRSAVSGPGTGRTGALNHDR